MKVNWTSLWQTFLTAIASGAGKWIIGIIVTSFALVLMVLPAVNTKQLMPRMSETIESPVVAAERSRPVVPSTGTAPPMAAAPPAMAPPRAAPGAPAMAPPIESISDSLAACVGLRAWRARHTSDSLTPRLQAALDRLERRCSVRDSVENIPR